MTWHAFRFIAAQITVLAVLAAIVVVIWFVPHRGWRLLRERGRGHIHHPFLRRHFISHEASWLRIGISIALAIAGLGFFLRTFREVMRDPAIAAVDLRLHNTLRIFHSSALHRLYSAVTLVASPTVVAAFVSAVGAILWLSARRREATALVIAFCGAAIASVALKYIVHRPRPMEAKGLAYGPSFPSGHTLLAISVYGLIAYLIARRRGTLAKVAAVAIAIYIVLVPMSRIYLGVHWPFDTIASLQLGAAWLIIVSLLMNHPPHFAHDVGQPKAAVLHGTRLWFGVVGSALACVAIFGAVDPVPRGVPKLPPPRIVPADVLRAFPLVKKTSEDLAGGPMEPAAFVFVGDAGAMTRAFERAGWSLAQTPSVHGLLHELADVIANRADPSGPATPSYFDAQPQDLTFEKAGTTSGSIRQRHHIRVWRTPLCVPQCTPLWVATCSYDMGVKFVAKPYLLTHRIDPRVDLEREFIAAGLRNAGARELGVITVTGPQRGRNAGGDAFFTDGRAHVIAF